MVSRATTSASGASTAGRLPGYGCSHEISDGGAGLVTSPTGMTRPGLLRGVSRQALRHAVGAPSGSTVARWA
jgi:hypothetical protein